MENNITILYFCNCMQCKWAQFQLQICKMPTLKYKMLQTEIKDINEW